MRGLFLCFLCFLVQALAWVHAEPQPAADYGRKTTGDGPPSPGSVYSEVASSAAGGGAASREPGSELVDAALVELRKIHHPFHHRKRKPQGLVGTALHYVLKAVPSFQISAPPPPPSSPPPPGSDAAGQRPPLSAPLAHAVGLLEEAAAQNHSDALFLLAEMHFWGNYTHPRDFRAAFGYYQQLARLDGNSSALHMLGLLYATGVGGGAPRDQARALLYHTFAADRGDTRAEMTLAYRHHAGIGAPKDCQRAARYYKRVADKAVAWFRAGPPGGRSWVPEAYRIADERGGVYGEGASAVSAGPNAVRGHPHSGARAAIDDIIEFWDLMAQKGDFKAAFNLGRVYYEGQRGLPADPELARRYFAAVAQRFWKKGGRAADAFKPGLDKTAAQAAGYLGRMYLRGEGVEPDPERARLWFERGSDFGDAQSQYGLGLMQLHGLGGVARNVAAAADRFKAAADQDFAPAQVQIGALYLDQGHADDVGHAHRYFEHAARYGHLEALYYLAEMSRLGVGRERSCAHAVGFYKSVAEKAEPLVSSWAEANAAYEAGDVELAFLGYLAAAEQGYEKAQNNVAYLLDPSGPRLPLPAWARRRLLGGEARKPALLRDPALALVYWTRSSRQGNIDALVKMGDYYLAGVGAERDVDKAVQCYGGAAEYHQSAQALYNLGWMHENGVGLTQDFHLAKRYYDAALETNEEAYLPVALSLLKLRARSAWNTVTHGRINSIRDEPAPKKEWSLSEWIAHFLQDDFFYYDDGAYDQLYDDGMPGGDSGGGGGGGGGGLAGDLDDDGILESLVIVGLAAALVVLVMYRQQRQQAAARRAQEEEAAGRQQQQAQQQQQQQAQQPQQQGFFPPPGHPEFGQWAVGGVGH